MDHDDREHVMRAAATLTDDYLFVIVRSQPILGPIP
jgi:hypothetical protein